MTLDYFFYLLIFPGFLFTGMLGLVVGWVDRKVSARFQFRVGPPFLQNFNDFFKLLGKETMIVKEGIHSLFIAAPFVAFAMLTLVSAMIGLGLFYKAGFVDDLFNHGHSGGSSNRKCVFQPWSWKGNEAFIG
jgi:NADH-quinone oxidoreductase subunit H